MHLCMSVISVFQKTKIIIIILFSQIIINIITIIIIVFIVDVDFAMTPPHT